MGRQQLIIGCLATVLITGLATAVCSTASHFLNPSNLIMVYLLAVVYVAARFGRAPAILATVLSVAEFDFFCVPPHFSFLVMDTQTIITLLVMLAVTTLITTLTSEVHRQAMLGRIREKRSEALRALSTEMSLLRGRDKLIAVALRHVRSFFDAQVGIYLPDENGVLSEYTANPDLSKLDRPVNEMAVWAFENKKNCGLGNEPFASSASLYIPLIASQGVVGVLQFSPKPSARIETLAGNLELLETFASQTALCIEVATLSERTQNAAMQIEREELRNVLLSSVSHDFRTPLATITGASSSLIVNKLSLSDAQKQELAQVILEEAEHLNNLVRNLLEMTKLESGPLTVKKKWHSIEETVGACLTRLERHLTNRQIHIQLPIDLPLVPYDEILIQQVFLNLLENAMKYTPEDSEIDIEAHAEPQAAGDAISWIAIKVSDRGPGLKSGEEEKIFIKFYRSNPSSQHMGVGLGLALCKAIVKAHGGTIAASNREGGGAEFLIRLPLSGTPPASIVEPFDAADGKAGGKQQEEEEEEEETESSAHKGEQA